MLNDNRGRLDLLPNPKYFEMSAFLKRKGKRKKNKRKRKNRKMKKLRICPICNISNEEYKFYNVKMSKLRIVVVRAKRNIGKGSINLIVLIAKSVLFNSVSAD